MIYGCLKYSTTQQYVCLGLIIHHKYPFRQASNPAKHWSTYISRNTFTKLKLMCLWDFLYCSVKATFSLTSAGILPAKGLYKGFQCLAGIWNIQQSKNACQNYSKSQAAVKSSKNKKQAVYAILWEQCNNPPLMQVRTLDYMFDFGLSHQKETALVDFPRLTKTAM